MGSCDIVGSLVSVGFCCGLAFLHCLGRVGFCLFCLGQRGFVFVWWLFLLLGAFRQLVGCGTWVRCVAWGG